MSGLVVVDARADWPLHIPGMQVVTAWEYLAQDPDEMSRNTRVYNLCLRMLSDPDAAADATQEAFLSAYRAMDRFTGGNFRSWMLRIASNACLDALRARNRHPAQSLERGRSMPGCDGQGPPDSVAFPYPPVDGHSVPVRRSHGHS